MKPFVLFINALFIFGIFNLFAPNEIPHTEAECIPYISALSIVDCDYDMLNEAGHIYRRGTQREAFLGTYEKGLAFDGHTAYQFIANKKTQIGEFPFEQCDLQAEQALKTIQEIIAQKLYTPYPDNRVGWKETYYYFRVSEKGLALFHEQNYEYGVIFCYFLKNEFKTVDLNLFLKKGERTAARYTFGTIEYEASIFPLPESFVTPAPQ